MSYFMLKFIFLMFMPTKKMCVSCFRSEKDRVVLGTIIKLSFFAMTAKSFKQFCCEVTSLNRQGSKKLCLFGYS